MAQEVTESLFGTPVYISDGYELSSENKDALIKEVKKNQRPNQNGNMISLNHYVLDIPYLSDFKKHIMKQVNKYVHEVLCITKNVEVYITQSWVNINHTDTSHHMHHHGNSFISGVYYLQGNTPITFDSKRDIFQNFFFEFTEKNYFNSAYCDVLVKEGRCILFPSILSHSVNPNKNKEERISLSFNTFIRGDLITTPENMSELTLK
tara:strand:+ start:60 stop:680 length:621 start_codon:yes stop_codon:yes gene_type:complete